MSAHRVGTVKIVYHREDGTWWADSPDMPGFSAVSDTFAGTRRLAIEDIPFYFDGETPASIDEYMENGAVLMPGRVMFLNMPNHGTSKFDVYYSAQYVPSTEPVGSMELQAA